jgi:hypothetical protein
LTLAQFQREIANVVSVCHVMLIVNTTIFTLLRQEKSQLRIRYF